VTLGCLILAENSQATALGQLTPEAMIEFAKVCRDAEAALQSAFQYDKINYIALMMVDPNVHFHLIPRYAALRQFDGLEFKDTGWPKHPDMLFTHDMKSSQLESLRMLLMDAWPHP
jgi:diadenosine tetraphosphate (Ap4A) HIT family hydrolase